MRWYWILLIVIVLYSMYIHKDDFMKNPMENIIDGAKQLFSKLFDSGKNAFNKDTNLTNYGKPSCVLNTDCNTIPLCNNCSCIGGECFG